MAMPKELMAAADRKKGKPKPSATILDLPGKPTGRIKVGDDLMAYWLPPGVTVDVESV